MTRSSIQFWSFFIHLLWQTAKLHAWRLAHLFAVLHNSRKKLFALTNHKVIYNYYLPRKGDFWINSKDNTLHLTFLKVVFESLRFHQDQLLLQRITAYFLWNQYLCSHIDLLQIKKLEHNRISTQFLLLHKWNMQFTQRQSNLNWVLHICIFFPVYCFVKYMFFNL